MGQRVIPVAVTAEYIGGAGVTLGAAGSHNSVVIEYDFRSAGPQWEPPEGGTMIKYVLWTNPQGNTTNRVDLGVDKLVVGYDGKVYHASPTADAMCVAGWAEMVVVGAVVTNGVETVKIKTEPSRFRVLPGSRQAADNEGIAATVADQLQTEIESVDSRKVSKPLTPLDPNGTDGQFLVSRGDGLTEWVDMNPDVVEEVLEKHPEWVTTVEENSLTTKHYKDGSVTTGKIADEAVTTGKIADEAVTTGKIADEAVTNEKLGADVRHILSELNADISAEAEARVAEDSAIRQQMTSPYNFKGTVSAMAALPSSGNKINDTYYVASLKYRVTWTGSAWQQSSMEESDYTDELAGLKSALETVINVDVESFSVDNQRMTSLGVAQSDTNCKRTDYIPCLPGTVVLWKGESFIYAYQSVMSLVAFYTSDKTLISNVTKISDEDENTVGEISAVAPGNTAYMVASTMKTDVMAVQLIRKNYLDPDEFSGTDTEKLQACLDLLKVDGGNILINRAFTLSGNLTNKLNTDATKKKYITFIGCGQTSMLKMGAYSFVSDLSNAAVGGLHFVNIDFEGTADCFNTNKLIRMFFDNCRFYGFRRVIYGEGITQSLYFTKCYFEGITDCVFLNVNGGVWNVGFSMCICENSRRFFNGDMPSGGSGNYNVVIRDCCIETITGDSAIFVGNNTHSFVVSGCYFEAAQPISLYRCGTFSLNIVIENNIFFLDENVPAIVMPSNNSEEDVCRGVIANNECIPASSLLAKESSETQLYPARFQFLNNIGTIDEGLYYVSYTPVYGKVVVSSYAGDMEANENVVVDNSADFRKAISITVKKQTTTFGDYNIGAVVYVDQNTGALCYVNGQTQTAIDLEIVAVIQDD